MFVFFISLINKVTVSFIIVKLYYSFLRLLFNLAFLDPVVSLNNMIIICFDIFVFIAISNECLHFHEFQTEKNLVFYIFWKVIFICYMFLGMHYNLIWLFCLSDILNIKWKLFSFLEFGFPPFYLQLISNFNITEKIVNIIFIYSLFCFEAIPVVIRAYYLLFIQVSLLWT